LQSVELRFQKKLAERQQIARVREKAIRYLSGQERRVVVADVQIRSAAPEGHRRRHFALRAAGDVDADVAALEASSV
jgi:hypothetical protein